MLILPNAVQKKDKTVSSSLVTKAEFSICLSSYASIMGTDTVIRKR